MEQCMAYRRHVAGTDAALAAAAERLRQGQLNAAGLAEAVSGALVSSGLQAMALQPARAVAGQAPWFDVECSVCCSVFRARWAEFLEQGGPAVVAADQPVRVAALAARSAWRNMKRRKKAQHLREQEAALIREYMSGSQARVWKHLKGPGVRSDLQGEPEEWTAYYRDELYGVPVAPLALSPEQLAIKEQLRACHAHQGGEAAPEC
jgi:hypothetical protein